MNSKLIPGILIASCVLIGLAIVLTLIELISYPSASEARAAPSARSAAPAPVTAPAPQPEAPSAEAEPEPAE